MPLHVVLLGDSIFDNHAYVQPEEPAVIDQLRTSLPQGSNATLLAIDGAIMSDVKSQFADLPRDATHLIVSAGGNDALGYSSILGRRVHAAQEVFDELAAVHQDFRLGYRAMLRELLGLQLPTAVCTIYDQIPMADRELRRHVTIALAPFNDAILREAAAARLPVLDLRTICDAESDFSDVSPIEPSSDGGKKIARAIAQLIAEHDFQFPRTVIYGY
jgi:lysophospholipase L1-like esterase